MRQKGVLQEKFVYNSKRWRRLNSTSPESAIIWLLRGVCASEMIMITTPRVITGTVAAR